MITIDIVKPARTAEEDDGARRRWLHFVEKVDTEILAEFGGTLAKGPGDSFVLEFDDPRSALSAAFAIQDAIARHNRVTAADQKLLVQMGIEGGDMLVDNDNGETAGTRSAGVMSTLAQPGEIIVSATVRSHLIPNLDADIEDMGEFIPRRGADPVRGYRVGPPLPGAIDMPVPAAPQADLRPVLAVVPFADRTNLSEFNFFGEIFAEELIRTLSQSHELDVISRLSTTALRGRGLSLEQISRHLKSDYVLSGNYRVLDLHFVLDLELADSRSGQVVWADRLEGRVDAVVSGQRDIIHHVVAGVSKAIETREVGRALSQSLPSLESYTLLLGAIGLMHRLSLRDFEEAQRLLLNLMDRAAKQSLPLAWLGKWHVLRVQQGWSPDPHQDARLALQYTTRALDADPHSSLALTIDGIVHTNLLKELDVAQERYELAIELNPSESLAWLLKGTLHAFRGEGLQAMLDTERASLLSPLDPHRYFYDSLAATACLAARRYDTALEYASRSLRANRTHTSTLRALSVAQWRLGQTAAAQQTAAELLKREPTLTVSRWLERSPSANYPIGQEWAAIFREIGIPN